MIPKPQLTIQTTSFEPTAQHTSLEESEMNKSESFISTASKLLEKARQQQQHSHLQNQIDVQSNRITTSKTSGAANQNKSTNNNLLVQEIPIEK